MLNRSRQRRATLRTNAEAAAWLARLQHEPREPSTEQALRVWLAEDERHRRAFALATDIWELLPGAVDADLVRPLRSRPRRTLALALVAVVFVSVAAAVAPRILPLQRLDYRSSVGEQRTVVLRDGTRLALNTDSAVAVTYRRGARNVVLQKGEAMFEVAKDKSRPFVVSVGNQEVKALGTTFLVKRSPDETAVTLVEGRVEVTRRVDRRRLQVAVLSPGERLRLIGRAGAVLDRPSMDAVTAWREGQVMFTDIGLLEAASELNRYAVGRYLVIHPSVANLRISGVFSTRDPVQFATTIAALYDLRIDRQGPEIALSQKSAAIARTH